MGDALDGDGGLNIAATARIRSVWMKFRDLLPFLTYIAPPLEMKGRVYACCVRSHIIMEVILGPFLEEDLFKSTNYCTG